MTKEEWLERYEKALIGYGVPTKFAHETALNADIDLDYSPECAASDEVSYMAADSDGSKK